MQATPRTATGELSELVQESDRPLAECLQGQLLGDMASARGPRRMSSSVPAPPAQPAPSKRRPRRASRDVLLDVAQAALPDKPASPSTGLASESSTAAASRCSTLSAGSSSGSCSRASSGSGHRLEAMLSARGRRYYKRPPCSLLDRCVEVGPDAWCLVFDKDSRPYQAPAQAPRQAQVRQAARDLLRARNGSAEAQELRERLERLKQDPLDQRASRPTSVALTPRRPRTPACPAGLGKLPVVLLPQP